MDDQVEIFEVGPRDGLQNEARMIPTADKIALCDMLSEAGFRRIEVASFVSPKWVPQMADGAEVLAGLSRATGVSYGALTPNLRGYEAAISANADEIAIFGSASEGFSRANLNRSVSEALDMFAPVADAAAAIGVPVRGYISCVTHCPYDGAVPVANTVAVAQKLRAMGCYEISLGDTIGQAKAADIRALLMALTPEIPAPLLAGHFHDTSGRALLNVAEALEHGVRVFDGAVGGLGGCPFAPGAAGNVSSEALAAFFSAQGLAHGLDHDALARAGEFARGLRGAGHE